MRGERLATELSSILAGSILDDCCRVSMVGKKMQNLVLSLWGVPCCCMEPLSDLVSSRTRQDDFYFGVGAFFSFFICIQAFPSMGLTNVDLLLRIRTPHRNLAGAFACGYECIISMDAL